jgi:hypothetical protein
MRICRETALAAVLVAASLALIGAPAAAATPATRAWILSSGGPLHTTAGSPLALTGAATPGGRLGFRWWVTAKPPGARPQLLGRRSRRARLLAGRPGRYVVRLAVRRRRNDGGTVTDFAHKVVVVEPAAAAGPSAASGPVTGPAAATAGATDGESADAPTLGSQQEPSCVAASEPMGCPIETITSTGGIQVGNQSYPEQGNWVQLVVLNANRLEPVGAAQSFDAARAGDLTKAIEAIPAEEGSKRNDDLVILSGQGNGYASLSAAQTKALREAFAKLGGELEPLDLTEQGKGGLAGGEWSLIGHIGTAAGSAEQNDQAQEAGVRDFLGGSAGKRGSLNGYLQIVNTAAYEFVSPEFIPIDTHAEGSTATQNVITVGSKTYRSQKLKAGEQGFQVLILPNEPDAEGPAAMNGTLTVRNVDGSIDTRELEGLRGFLRIVRNSDEPGQLLMVLQSFGRADNPGLQQISNDPDWIEDTLPAANLSRPEHDDGEYDFFRWCGNGESGHTAPEGKGKMNGYTCELFPDTATSYGTKDTITEAIGELAGMRGRDEVADLGFQGQPEGLSLIGPAHPYGAGDANLAVGAEGERTIAVLRRSRQSQWTASAPSPGTTDSSGQPLFDPASMWEVIFGTEPEPWPVSGPPGSALANAGKYIAERLFPGDGYTDVRQAYATAPTWISSKPGELAGLTYPTDERARFGRADFEALKKELLTVEFPDLAAVDTMTQGYQEVFGTAKVNGLINFNDNKNEIITKALHDNEAFERATATVEEGPSVGSALYFAAETIGAFGPETEPITAPLGFFASAYDFFSELYGSTTSEETGKQPFEEPQEITDEASKLAVDMAERYQTLSETFGHFEILYDTDWSRLKKAAQYATGQWSLPPYSAEHPQLGLLQQSLATAGQAGLYEALVPLAYEQWVVSPWYTDAGGDNNNEGPKNVYGTPGPSEYFCHDEDSAGPFGAFPATSLAWIRFEADSAGGEKNHFTGRALVSKADPLVLQQASESIGSGEVNYPGVRSNGAAPEAALTEKLFDRPSRASNFSFPDGLGLDKVGFFGMPSWSTPRLQCGMPLAYRIEEAE